MVGRTCGGCTACCKTHYVVSIAKPPMTWCSQCTKGVGCGVYDSRPDDCRAFHCQWLMGYGAQEERPDLVRVVVDYSRNPVLNNELVGQLWEVSYRALQSSFAHKVIKQMMGAKMPIMTIDVNCKHRLLLPYGFPLTPEAYNTFKKDEVPMKNYRAL